MKLKMFSSFPSLSLHEDEMCSIRDTWQRPCFYHLVLVCRRPCLFVLRQPPREGFSSLEPAWWRGKEQISHRSVLFCIAIWLVSVVMGALQTNIYAELALMFPNKSGSLPSYCREAYERYSPLVGPFVAWGYWLGWCVVLSINGLLVGEYLRAAAFPNTDPVLFPKIVGTVMLVAMMSIDLLGLRLGKWVRYLLGFL